MPTRLPLKIFDHALFLELSTSKWVTTSRELTGMRRQKREARAETLLIRNSNRFWMPHQLLNGSELKMHSNPTIPLATIGSKQLRPATA